MKPQLMVNITLLSLFSVGFLTTACLQPVAATQVQAENVKQVRNINYPANVVQNFIRGCVSFGEEQAICTCIIKKIQTKYTLEQFSQIEVKAKATGRVPEEMLNIAGSCRVSAK